MPQQGPRTEKPGQVEEEEAGKWVGQPPRVRLLGIVSSGLGSDLGKAQGSFQLVGHPLRNVGNEQVGGRCEG